MIAINKVELSPNNMAKCQRCREKVKRGLPRAKTSTYYGDGYLCYKCTGLAISGNRAALNLYENELKILVKKCGTKIIIEELGR